MVTQTGCVKCWGQDDFGQLGNGNDGNPDPGHLVAVAAFCTGQDKVPADSIAVGAFHNCAMAGNRVWCWGKNGDNQVNGWNSSSITVPVEVTLPD